MQNFLSGSFRVSTVYLSFVRVIGKFLMDFVQFKKKKSKKNNVGKYDFANFLRDLNSRPIE
jgi:hypothetical protein